MNSPGESSIVQSENKELTNKELSELSDVDTEIDEELSDHEGEEEQIISLPLYLCITQPSVSKKTNALIPKDPLMVANDEKKNLRAQNFVCCYCPFISDNESYLSTHIKQEHEGKSQTYMCPHCHFQTSNLVEWITHKGACENRTIKMEVDETEFPQVSQNPSLEELERQNTAFEELELNPETPLLRVKSEFKTANLEISSDCSNPLETDNSSKIHFLPFHSVMSKLVINCYQPPTEDSSFTKQSLKSLLKPLEENNCRVTIHNKHLRLSTPFKQTDNEFDSSNSSNYIFKKIHPRCTTRIVKKKEKFKLNIMGDDVVDVIRYLIKQHDLEDHNYCELNLMWKFGLACSNDKNKLVRAFCHLRSKFLKWNELDIRSHPEQIETVKLMRQLQCTLKNKYKTKVMIRKCWIFDRKTMKAFANDKNDEAVEKNVLLKNSTEEARTYAKADKSVGKKILHKKNTEGAPRYARNDKSVEKNIALKGSSDEALTIDNNDPLLGQKKEILKTYSPDEEGPCLSDIKILTNPLDVSNIDGPKLNKIRKVVKVKKKRVKKVHNGNVSKTNISQKSSNTITNSTNTFFGKNVREKLDKNILQLNNTCNARNITNSEKNTDDLDEKISKPPQLPSLLDEPSTKIIEQESKAPVHTCKNRRRKKKCTNGKIGYWTRRKGIMKDCAACIKDLQKEM